MSRRRLHIALGIMLLGALFLVVAGYLLWQERAASADGTAPAGLAAGEQLVALRLTVRDTGLAAISAETLASVGLAYESLAADSLSLSRDGQTVPFHVEGAGEEALLIFFAEAIESPAEAAAVYWLEPGSGQALPAVNAAPDGPATTSGRLQYRLDDNNTFVAFATGDDNWFAQRLFAPGPLSSFTVPIEHISAEAETAELRLRLWSNNGISNITPDHHLQATLNDNVVLDYLWDGAALEEVTTPIPAGLLRAADNQLTLALPADTGAPGEDVYLDFLELAYTGPLQTGAGQLRFRSGAPNLAVATDWVEPLVVAEEADGSRTLLTDLQLLEGQLTFAGGLGERTYWLADKSGLIRPEISLVPERQTLKAADRGAHYVAIVADAPGFAEATQTLLNHRTANGLESVAIAVNQIYDEFGYGRQTPAALRDFIAYATAQWQPAPRFILLVGDANYDIHGFTDSPNRNLIPTQMIHSQFAGSVASDTWFTLAEGELVPNVALGRLPVQTAAELEAIVAKIIAYETAADNGWQRRALLVADDEALFDNVSDALDEELAGAGYQTDKLYMSQNEAIHDDIIAQLDEGVGLLNYVGHGSIQVWGDEQVLSVDDAGALEGNGHYPIFTTFTCLNGYFNHPQVDALAESLLRVENGGIVAAIAPSGRSLTNQQQPIADVFFAQLLTYEATTLGEALLSAKAEGADNEFLRDVIHTFNLLGDPALQFQHPGD